jgi:GDPmannose 4,6-dehydratase
MNHKAARSRALICGVSGQDGALLARLLLDRGYEVWGTSRDAETSSFAGLVALGIRERVKVVSMSPVDFRSVIQVVADVEPHEIYNLAGQSSVGLSFAQPIETIESISTGVLNLLEAIRFLDKAIRLYNAGSGECFGDTGGRPADESTPFMPRSPYAVAKSAATWQVRVYRESYGLFACTGILFNHESPLRPERFVTRKIVATARRIADGSAEKLRLGNLDIRRDWGFAPEYVEAMWRMLDHTSPEDFVIATGVTMNLQQFIEIVFGEAGLDWREHVVPDQQLLRPLDLKESNANPGKAARVLGWIPRLVGASIPRELYRAEGLRATAAWLA